MAARTVVALYGVTPVDLEEEFSRLGTDRLEEEFARFRAATRVNG
ncbi:hypothetical protein ACFXI6_48460 [Streptomyces mirabilis]